MSYVQQHSDAMSQITGVWKELRYLSNAFSATGNADMSDRLQQMVYTLSEAQATCQDIFGKQITERYNDARQASLNMLAAAFAVATRPEDTHGPS
mgnify:CR=1 FL=1